MPSRTAARRRSPFGARVLGPRDQAPRQLRIRIQVLLTAMLVATNVLGAVVVFVVNTWAIPAPRPTGRMTLALAIAIPTYVVLAAIVGAVWGTTLALRSLRWATQADVDPDRSQRTRALRVPFTLTVVQFVTWTGGTILFTLLTVFLQPSRTCASPSGCVASAWDRGWRSSGCSGPVRRSSGC